MAALFQTHNMAQPVLVIINLAVIIALISCCTLPTVEASACQSFCASKTSNILEEAQCVEEMCRAMNRQRVSRFGKRNFLSDMVARGASSKLYRSKPQQEQSQGRQPSKDETFL